MNKKPFENKRSFVPPHDADPMLWIENIIMAREFTTDETTRNRLSEIIASIEETGASGIRRSEYDKRMNNKPLRD